MMISRLVVQKVEEALNRQAAVALIGPRQVGKTTLALAFVVHAGDDRYQISKNVEAIGLRQLSDLLLEM